jgi:hypothetical protein
MFFAGKIRQLHFMPQDRPSDFFIGIAGREVEKIELLVLTTSRLLTVANTSSNRTGIFEIACDLWLIRSDFILSLEGTFGFLSVILDTGDPFDGDAMGRL